MNAKTLKLLIVITLNSYTVLYGQSTERIVVETVGNYAKYSEFKSFQLQAEFYEYAIYNNKVCMYTDGYGYLCSAGYNCPIPVDNYSFVAEQIRKSNRSEQWLKQMKNLYKKTPVRKQTDFPPGWDYLLNSFRRIELEGILNPQKVGLYKILSSERKDEHLLSVNFVHKKNSQLSGELLINLKTKSIERLHLINQKFYSPQLGDWSTGDLIVSFREINNKNFVKDLIIEVCDNDFKYYIALHVYPEKVYNYPITETDYNMLSQNDINPYVYYDESTFKEITCNEKILPKAINDFRGKSELTKQFVSNANKPFYISETYSGGGKTERKAKEIHDYIQKIVQLIKQSDE
ncbi:MAG: hypothetical protein ACLFVR_00290 [Thiohalospira sp.]